MQVENESPTPARSKLEFLYRDLLIECQRLSQRQEAISQQAEDAATHIDSFTNQLRQTTYQATQQASTRIQHAAESVCTSLKEANQQLLTAHKHQINRSHHNLMMVAAIAAGAGLLGGLLGVLIAALVLI